MVKRVERGQGRRIPQLKAQSAWTMVLDPPKGVLDPPEDDKPHAWIRLKSGVEFSGVVHTFSRDLPLADREILLKPPLLIHRVGAAEHVDFDCEIVVIQGSEIDVLAVSYYTDEEVNVAIEAQFSDRTGPIAN